MHNVDKNEAAMRSFLKYPGGKGKLVEQINACLKEGDKLIEPFVGAGNVFANSDFDRYLLNDVNRDIALILTLLKTEKERFIAYCEQFFTGKFNNNASYYELRDIFNNLDYGRERAAIFLYLNRHGFNGLCRYNKSGAYNVPFGKYDQPYFPEKEMLFYAEKLKRAEVICGDFGEAFRRSRRGQVIYADPPYFCLPGKKSFTTYSGKEFDAKEQSRLALLSVKAQSRGVRVVISNHDVPDSRLLYREADITTLSINRNISCKEREAVDELIAVYG